MDYSTKCFEYLVSKISDATEEILSYILDADPDNGANCQWIIDSYEKGQFILPEDIPQIKEEIEKFRKYFGLKRPLPRDGYSFLKEANRKQETKGTTSKEQRKTMFSSTTNQKQESCYAHFKAIKNKFGKQQGMDELFEIIEGSNPTDDPRICIWILETYAEQVVNKFNKKIDMTVDDLVSGNVRKYISVYIDRYPNYTLPTLNPPFVNFGNYTLLKDIINKQVDLVAYTDRDMILIPKNKQMAIYYGQQTSWCTARNDAKNMFDYYDGRGLIYIIFDFKNRKKYQIQLETAQVKDEVDNDVSYDTFNDIIFRTSFKNIFNPLFQTIKNVGSLGKLNEETFNTFIIMAKVFSVFKDQGIKDFLSHTLNSERIMIQDNLDVEHLFEIMIDDKLNTMKNFLFKNKAIQFQTAFDAVNMLNKYTMNNRTKQYELNSTRKNIVKLVNEKIKSDKNPNPLLEMIDMIKKYLSIYMHSPDENEQDEKLSENFEKLKTMARTQMKQSSSKKEKSIDEMILQQDISKLEEYMKVLQNLEYKDLNEYLLFKEFVDKIREDIDLEDMIDLQSFFKSIRNIKNLEKVVGQSNNKNMILGYITLLKAMTNFDFDRIDKFVNQLPNPELVQGEY